MTNHETDEELERSALPIGDELGAVPEHEGDDPVRQDLRDGKERVGVDRYPLGALVRLLERPAVVLPALLLTGERCDGADRASSLTRQLRG